MNNTIDNTKLAGVLKTFDKSYRLSAKRFLESPYFNSSKEIVNLFLEILRLQEKDKPLDKVKLWKKIVKNKPYNDLRFRKYCSDLSKLIERFLAQQAFEDDEIQQRVFLLKSLNTMEHKAEKTTASTITATEKLIETYAYRDSEYYAYQYEFQRQLYKLYDYETKRSAQSNLNEISSFLDQFYFTEKLRITTEALQRKNFKTSNYDIAFTEALQEYLESQNLHNDSGAIALYYQVYKMWSDLENEDHYYELKSLIESSSHLFPAEKAISDFYTTAQNYCVRKINSGERKFLNELFDLFQLLIDRSLIISDGIINPWYFRNIVFVGLRLGKYDWTENFIITYQDYLSEELRENAVTFNLAQLYFYQKKYEKVIQQLRFVEYDDLSYNLNSKVMLMLTYYELDEIEPLYSLTDTFRTYLSRQRKLKKLPQSKVQDYLHLIRFVRQLIKVIPGDKKALQKLKEEIQSTKGVVNANWLLEKIAELE